MKIAVVVAVIVAATINTKLAEADMVDVFLNIGKDAFLACAKQNGYTETKLREIYDKEITLGMDKATCLGACTMKELGALKDSKLSPEKMNIFIKIAYAKAPDKIPAMQKLVVECIEKVKTITDECQMTFAFVDCFMGQQ
ncbi:uncharacterized protein LOC144472850 [Augochlora pura]